MKKESELSLSQLRQDIRSTADKDRVAVLQRFFKTGKGEYGEGDVFVGLTVPQSRMLAKKYASSLSLQDIETLLKSKIHEERLISLLILLAQFQKADAAQQGRLYRFYVKNAKRVNNWDLVDTSAPGIVGAYLLDRPRKVLYKLARSKNIWERRIAMLSTFHFIYQKESQDTLQLAEILLHDSEDLIHKAVGWMLREVGKRVSEKDLTMFLDKHAHEMPRTMLRYSLEHLKPQQRQKYLKQK
ncbi:DNA alkylation repair protein [Bdellovibrio sp.]|uniref:DNA alkylation repair protein n=1 Tax=Bdellovibrio sp. TaxID=28201 RepID=UPI003221E8B8